MKFHINLHSTRQDSNAAYFRYMENLIHSQTGKKSNKLLARKFNSETWFIWTLQQHSLLHVKNTLCLSVPE